MLKARSGLEYLPATPCRLDERPEGTPWHVVGGRSQSRIRSLRLQAYAALAAHHVRAPAQVIHCGRFVTSTRPNTYEHACRLTYSFLGQAYYDVIFL